MPTTTQAPRGADLFRHQAHLVRQVVGMNLAGVTHDESLAHPPGGGNSINWVLGHLVWTYEGALPLLGREPVLPKGAVERYARGSAQLAEGEEKVQKSRSAVRVTTTAPCTAFPDASVTVPWSW